MFVQQQQLTNLNLPQFLVPPKRAMLLSAVLHSNHQDVLLFAKTCRNLPLPKLQFLGQRIPTLIFLGPMQDISFLVVAPTNQHPAAVAVAEVEVALVVAGVLSI
jgi:hypothetical protein